MYLQLEKTGQGATRLMGGLFGPKDAASSKNPARFVLRFRRLRCEGRLTQRVAPRLSADLWLTENAQNRWL